MDPRVEDASAARHELVIAGVALVALARIVDVPWAWVVAGLALVAMVAGGAGVLEADEGGRRVPAASLIVPAVLAAGAAGAIRLVPVGLGLLPALLLLAVLLDRAIALEMRLLRQPAGPTPGDRSRVMLAIVVAAFVAFTGVGALVPGALVSLDGTDVAAGTEALTEASLVTLALADGLAALLLGYRAAALRYGARRSAVLSALTYGVVIVIAAGAVRAIDLPRLVAPAVLTLVFYLWDALHGSAPARRREARFLWEVLLLAALAAVVVAWNLQLRG